MIKCVISILHVRSAEPTKITFVVNGKSKQVNEETDLKGVSMTIFEIKNKKL